MATFTKLMLSGSVNGLQIPINATSSSNAIPIHTSVASTSSMDEIYIYATNISTFNPQLTILWGNTGSYNKIISSVLSQTGRILICDGMLLNNSQTVYAFAGSTGSILIDGFVNRIQ